MSFGRDSQDMLYYGKRFKGLNTPERDRDGYLKSAAKLFATGDDLKKRRRLMFWWIEGVRDYCADQAEVQEMDKLLREETAKHIMEGR